jgi:hypothetical protein
LKCPFVDGRLPVPRGSADGAVRLPLPGVDRP